MRIETGLGKNCIGLVLTKN